jgi:hypothetical protein
VGDAEFNAPLRESAAAALPITTLPARGHGVLSFDSSEPEFWSVQEAGVACVPTLVLTLPSEIDVLWCLIGSILLRYESEQGWQSVDVSP